MKTETRAEFHVALSEHALEHMRERTLLAYRVMTDGQPEQFKKYSRQVISFYETETTPEIWRQMAMLPNPDNPQESIADSWLRDWEQKIVQVGVKADGNDTRSGARSGADAAGSADDAY